MFCHAYIDCIFVSCAVNAFIICRGLCAYTVNVCAVGEFWF